RLAGQPGLPRSGEGAGEGVRGDGLVSDGHEPPTVQAASRGPSRFPQGGRVDRRTATGGGRQRLPPAPVRIATAGYRRVETRSRGRPRREGCRRNEKGISWSR